MKIVASEEFTEFYINANEVVDGKGTMMKLISLPRLKEKEDGILTDKKGDQGFLLVGAHKGIIIENLRVH